MIDITATCTMPQICIKIAMEGFFLFLFLIVVLSRRLGSANAFGVAHQQHRFSRRPSLGFSNNMDNQRRRRMGRTIYTLKVRKSSIVAIYHYIRQVYDVVGQRRRFGTVMSCSECMVINSFCQGVGTIFAESVHDLCYTVVIWMHVTAYWWHVSDNRSRSADNGVVQALHYMR